MPTTGKGTRSTPKGVTYANDVRGLNVNRDNPLWLPIGSVRSILALGFSAVGLASVIGAIEAPEWFVLLVGIIIRDYFAERASNNQPLEPIVIDE